MVVPSQFMYRLGLSGAVKSCMLRGSRGDMIHFMYTLGLTEFVNICSVLGSRGAMAQRISLPGSDIWVSKAV